MSNELARSELGAVVESIVTRGDISGLSAQDRAAYYLRLCESLGLKPKQAFAPIRIAIAGSTVSAGLFESIALLGRDEALRRLQRARAAV